MKVLVTGGSGHLGQFVVRDLLVHGYEVVNADRRPPANTACGQSSPARFIQTDVGSVGEVAGALVGCEAVVHLGAIPAPYRHADEVVFNNNTQATFAVLHASSLLGINRAVIASSISAYGSAYSPAVTVPLYAPVDEDHPLLNHDAYGLSKEVDERTGQMFHRRTGMSMAAMRFHWVAAPGGALARVPIANAALADPETSRVLWGYVDARDAASICRLALESDAIGFEAFNVTAADTLAELPTEDLLRRYAPSVEIRQPIPGFASPYSIEKAKRLLGWAPRHSWRDEATG
ncbi:MAG: NAD(P)-dependent oxidoreductase [Chloroflexota bacterium]|nr:NAD(P)-dependent oxidoreductase [Chloroflexota bacterium]